MATTKCTMILQAASNVSSPEAAIHRIGGWTESFYDPDTNLDQVKRDFNKLCQKRAALLGLGAAVLGQRYNQVDPVGPANSTANQYPGYATSNVDIPQMALLCKLPGLGMRNSRAMILRGVPDAMVVEGEYAPNARYQSALRAFFRELERYFFKGKDLAQTQWAVDNITNEGVITTELVHDIAVNDYVRVLRTVDANGNKVGGRFRVSAVASHGITLERYTKGAATHGKVTKDVNIFCEIDWANISVGRTTTRRVGRPTQGYSGRGSKKK